jgi:hypothetical protein
MKIVTLNWIYDTRRPQAAPEVVETSPADDENERPEGEDDGLGILPDAPTAQNTPVVPEVEELTTKIALDAGQIRTFYPRKGDRVGTRVILRGGTAYPVTETFEEVKAAIDEATAGVVVRSGAQA